MNDLFSVFKKDREFFLELCSNIVSVSFGEDDSDQDGEETSTREILDLELLKFFVYICDAGRAFTEDDAALFISFFDVGFNEDLALQFMEKLKADGNLEATHFAEQPISLEIAQELDNYLASIGQTEYCAVDAVIGLFEKLGQIVAEEKKCEACRERAEQYVNFLRSCTQSPTGAEVLSKENPAERRRENMGMDKYEEVKMELDRFMDLLPDAADREQVKSYLTACMLKIWGSNILYSPDYEKLLSVLFEKNYTTEQVVTAMGCCGDEERTLLVPEFFEQVAASEANRTSQVINALNDLLVAAAMINGDFTVEEANTLTKILSRLVSYAGDRGVTVPVSWDHRQKITERNEDSYLQNREALKNAGKSELREPEMVLSAADAGDEKGGTGNAEENPEEQHWQGSLHTMLQGLVQDLVQDVTVQIESDSGTETTPVVSKPEEDGEETMESLLEELDSLVGLESVKQDVHSLMNFIKVTKLREQRGMNVPKISYHLVFTGNPGTGKTTVARLVAKLYYHMGILPKGQLVETDRSMLVAGYLGQTAIKTQKVIQEALGGVLFIDEAYSLANDAQDSYGKEAIETILKAMEDHRDELVVIVAGYTDLMHQFIESNPGLSSRFSKYFEFPDYTPDELLAIFERFCRTNGYALEKEAAVLLKEKFEILYAERNEHFGNARTARNYFEKSINAQADRLARQTEISDKDLTDLIAEDIAAAVGGNG